MQLANHTLAITVVTCKFNADNQFVTAIVRAQLRFLFKLKSYGSFFLKGCVACAFSGAVSHQVLKKDGKKRSQKIQSSWYFLW
jgi:hypothetical protein